MTSDTPQGDPRLQRTSPGPQVAAGYVDPCIVYLETTLPGEIPLVVACWARSSREIRNPGQGVQMELQDVVAFHGEWRRHPVGKHHWLVTTRKVGSLTLKHGTKNRAANSSYLSPFQSDPPPVCQWAVRYLDPKTDASLRSQFGQLTNLRWLKPLQIHAELSKRKALSKRVFELSRLDWPSIAEIIATLEPPRRTKRPSLVYRLVSAVFRKKTKALAPA